MGSSLSLVNPSRFWTAGSPAHSLTPAPCLCTRCPLQNAYAEDPLWSVCSPTTQASHPSSAFDNRANCAIHLPDMFTNHLQDIGDLESQVHLVSPQCSTHSFNFYHQRFHPQDESCQFTIGCPTCRGSSPSATKTAPSCVWFAFPSKISSIENNRNPKSTRFGAPNDSVALKKQLGSTTKSITPQLLRENQGCTVLHRTVDFRKLAMSKNYRSSWLALRDTILVSVTLRIFYRKYQRCPKLRHKLTETFGWWYTYPSEKCSKPPTRH